MAYGVGGTGVRPWRRVSGLAPVCLEAITGEIDRIGPRDGSRSRRRPDLELQQAVEIDSRLVVRLGLVLPAVDGAQLHPVRAAGTGAVESRLGGARTRVEESRFRPSCILAGKSIAFSDESELSRRASRMFSA